MKSIAIMAVGGLACAAGAQGITVHFDADQTDAPWFSTVSWTVSVSFTGYDDPTAFFGGFVGDFLAGGINQTGNAHDLVSLMAGNATIPTDNGGSVEGINIFHHALLDTDDPSNPIDIFTFNYTDAGGDTLEYGAAGLWSMFADDVIFTQPDEFTDPTIISDTVRFTPAPGGLMLIGLGGLAAARRRR